MASRGHQQVKSGGQNVSATDAKNAFGRVLEDVIRGERVVITKHDAPKAVLMSFEEYSRLTTADERVLDDLTQEFDDLLLRIQRLEARAGTAKALAASSREFGRASGEATKAKTPAKRNARATPSG